MHGPLNVKFGSFDLHRSSVQDRLITLENGDIILWNVKNQTPSDTLHIPEDSSPCFTNPCTVVARY